MWFISVPCSLLWCWMLAKSAKLPHVVPDAGTTSSTAVQYDGVSGWRKAEILHDELRFHNCIMTRNPNLYFSEFVEMWCFNMTGLICPDLLGTDQISELYVELRGAFLFFSSQSFSPLRSHGSLKANIVTNLNESQVQGRKYDPSPVSHHLYTIQPKH